MPYTPDVCLSFRFLYESVEIVYIAVPFVLLSPVDHLACAGCIIVAAACKAMLVVCCLGAQWLSSHKFPSKSTSPNHDKNSMSLVEGSNASTFSLGYDGACGATSRFWDSKRSRTFFNATIPSSHMLLLPSSDCTTSRAATSTLSCWIMVERGREGDSMPSWSCFRSSIAREAALGMA